MKPRRRFLFAFMASLALHLGFLTSASWRWPMFDLPREHEAAPTISAKLLAPRRPPATAARKASAAQKPPVAVPTAKAVPELLTPPLVPPVAQTVPDSEPLREEPLFGTGEPVAAEPSGDITLPRLARIRYRVTLGEHGFVIGQAVQELRHDDRTYEMRNVAATTGLAGLFRPVTVENISTGDITARGLRPRAFSIERSKGTGEWATFDWQAGRVTLSNGRDFSLEPGTQDMLSMFAQLSMMLGDSSVVSLLVATGKKVERYYFTVLGEETIMTPRGERLTVHLRGSQSMERESTELWLGRDDALLPIKIRHVDRRGDIYEQIAETVEFDAEMEGAR